MSLRAIIMLFCLLGMTADIHAEDRKLTVIFTNDVIGEVEPCG